MNVVCCPCTCVCVCARVVCVFFKSLLTNLFIAALARRYFAEYKLYKISDRKNEHLRTATLRRSSAKEAAAKKVTARGGEDDRRSVAGL